MGLSCMARPNQPEPLFALDEVGLARSGETGGAKIMMVAGYLETV